MFYNYFVSDSSQPVELHCPNIKISIRGRQYVFDPIWKLQLLKFSKLLCKKPFMKKFIANDQFMKFLPKKEFTYPVLYIKRDIDILRFLLKPKNQGACVNSFDEWMR